MKHWTELHLRSRRLGRIGCLAMSLSHPRPRCGVFRCDRAAVMFRKKPHYVTDTITINHTDLNHIDRQQIWMEKDDRRLSGQGFGRHPSAEAAGRCIRLCESTLI